MLLDEMFSTQIAIRLRLQEHDVVSAHEIEELCEEQDPIVFHWARRNGRAVMTENVVHFVPLHTQCMLEQAHHFGLILTSPKAMSRNVDPVGQFVRALDPVLRGNRRDDALRDAVLWLQPASIS